MSQLIHPEDYPHMKHNWYEAIQNKQASQSEYRVPHANGHWIWIESHYMPVTCEKGEVDKVVVISRDVTDRKNTEELIRDTEKLSVVGELAAGIAHEIRNPLTTIKGFTQMMLKEPSPPFFLNLMYEELNRIELITTELLCLAKPQIQDVKENNINELIVQVTTLLNPEAMLNNTILTVKFEKDLPAITCVANHLKQVFINLLKNALEAMPAGGEILIETKQEEEGTSRE